MVPDCSRLNWRVISNRQPPMKLAPVREAPGRRPRNGAPPKPRRPPPGPCAWAGYPLSPPVRGAVGERNAARFFAASVAPSRGVWGTKLCPFFSSFWTPNTKVGIPTLLPTTHIEPFCSSKTGRCHNSSNLMNAGTATCHRLKSSLLFDRKRAGGTISQIWLNMTPPQDTTSKARYFFDQNGPLSQLARFGEC